METFLIGLIATAITTALTTIISVSIKHSYESKIQQEKNRVSESEKKSEEQRKEYERLLEEEKTRSYRKLILEEIDPLVEELNRVKDKIETDEIAFEKSIQELKTFHNHDKEEVYGKLDDLIIKHEANFKRIRESYKYRFIQLCKTYLNDGFITTAEWDQLTTMYDLYHGLGGNGQAEDYYEQVKKLQFVSNDEL